MPSYCPLVDETRDTALPLPFPGWAEERYLEAGGIWKLDRCCSVTFGASDGYSGTVSLEGYWTLFHPDGGKAITIRRTIFSHTTWFNISDYLLEAGYYGARLKLQPDYLDSQRFFRAGTYPDSLRYLRKKQHHFPCIASRSAYDLCCLERWLYVMLTRAGLLP